MCIYTNEARWLFLSHFWPLLKRASYYEVARKVAKIGSSLKRNHHNQVMLVQIRDTFCMMMIAWIRCFTRKRSSKVISPNLQEKNKEKWSKTKQNANWISRKESISSLSIKSDILQPANGCACVSRCQFHQRVYAQLLHAKVPKAQKAAWIDCLFCAFGICEHKCYDGEIGPWWKFHQHFESSFYASRFTLLSWSTV